MADLNQFVHFPSKTLLGVSVLQSSYIVYALQHSGKLQCWEKKEFSNFLMEIGVMVSITPISIDVLMVKTNHQACSQKNDDMPQLPENAAGDQEQSKDPK